MAAAGLAACLSSTLEKLFFYLTPTNIKKRGHYQRKHSTERKKDLCCLNFSLLETSRYLDSLLGAELLPTRHASGVARARGEIPSWTF
jgi:hypothetical protein